VLVIDYKDWGLNVKKSKYWLLANVVGLVGFFYFSSRLWSPTGEKGLLGGPGDPLIWAISILPILLVITVINLVWLFKLLFRVKKESWRVLMAWVLVVIIWFCALWYDHYRSYDGSEVLPITSSAS
jgi:uncharacterized BrkB/YihY/UPF0761 family membrane protein